MSIAQQMGSGEGGVKGYINGLKATEHTEETSWMRGETFHHRSERSPVAVTQTLDNPN